MALKRIRKEQANYEKAEAEFKERDQGVPECDDGLVKYVGDIEPDAHREIKLTFGYEDDW